MEIISVDILMSKGISYRNWFKEDWRNDDPLAVCHTGLCHSISIFNELFKIKTSNIKTKVFYNEENQVFDTAVAFSLSNKPLLKSIFSWGAPKSGFNLNLLSTNSLISIEENRLQVRKPRDSFDSEGRFITPEIFISENIESDSLTSCLSNFLHLTKEKISLDKELFQRSIEIGRLCLLAEKINTKN